MAHQGRYGRRITPYRDRSAPCGCRQVLIGSIYRTVVWCPEHQDRPCPGPWHGWVSSRERFNDENDDYCDDFDDQYEDDEYDAWEEAMQECGKVPMAQGGCLNAGTEYCDFECPFRDEDDGDA